MATFRLDASPFMGQPDCHFCRLETNRIRLEGEYALALLDGFPVTQGRTLIVPKRHVASLFELPAEEQAAVWANLIFTPVKFGMRNLPLAAVDILVVWATNIWMVVAVWRHYRWVAVAQVPYFVWVSLATVLQLSVTAMNWGR